MAKQYGIESGTLYTTNDLNLMGRVFIDGEKTVRSAGIDTPYTIIRRSENQIVIPDDAKFGVD